MLPYLWLILWVDCWAVFLLKLAERQAQQLRQAEARKRLVLDRLMAYRRQDWNSAA